MEQPDLEDDHRELDSQDIAVPSQEDSMDMAGLIDKNVSKIDENKVKREAIARKLNEQYIVSPNSPTFHKFVSVNNQQV